MRLNIQYKITLIITSAAVILFLGAYFYTDSIILKKVLIGCLPAAVALSGLLWLVLFFYISRPVRRISSVIEQIAAGNYSKRISLLGRDEIGDLGGTVNEMSRKIRTRVDEIELGKSRFEAILLSMFDGVMVIDYSGKILLMNEALKNLLQVEINPVWKKPLEVIRNIEIQEIANNALNLKSGVESREINILLPRERILQVNASPVVKDNEIIGAVLVFHDITELRRLENIRKDFVANVSHELRTPITNIKGYSETLLDGALDDKKNAKDFLQIIHSDADRLAQLVEDLLDLSRIESGGFTLNLVLCDLRNLVDRVLQEVREQAKTKGIVIQKDIPPTPLNIKIDEKSISQVLLNLVDNAIKYNNKGGSVVISAKDSPALIEVSVTDTGIGIPKEDLERIFERFYRVDKGRSRELGGTGLGLSIAKHLVGLHRGRIFVESELDHGTTFRFTIPKT